MSTDHSYETIPGIIAAELDSLEPLDQVTRCIQLLDAMQESCPRVRAHLLNAISELKGELPDVEHEQYMDEFLREFPSGLGGFPSIRRRVA